MSSSRMPVRAIRKAAVSAVKIEASFGRQMDAAATTRLASFDPSVKIGI